MRAYDDENMLTVGTGKDAKKIRDDRKKFEEDYDGANMTTPGNTKAWVAYQSTSLRNKGTREDAYFMGGIPPTLMANLKNLTPEMQKKIVETAINQTIENLQQTSKEQNSGGTTLAATVCIGDKAYLINVGDSIICKYEKNKLSEPLMEAHDNTNENERKRAKIQPGARFGGFLAVSRSIGAFSAKEGPIIYQAEIKAIDIKPGQELMLASDGLEKKIKGEKTGLQLLTDNKEAKPLHEKAEALVKNNKIELKAKDDTTIMIVDPTKVGILVSLMVTVAKGPPIQSVNNSVMNSLANLKKLIKTKSQK